MQASKTTSSAKIKVGSAPTGDDSKRTSSNRPALGSHKFPKPGAHFIEGRSTGDIGGSIPPELRKALEGPLAASDGKAVRKVVERDFPNYLGRIFNDMFPHGDAKSIVTAYRVYFTIEKKVDGGEAPDVESFTRLVKRIFRRLKLRVDRDSYRRSNPMTRAQDRPLFIPEGNIAIAAVACYRDPAYEMMRRELFYRLREGGRLLGLLSLKAFHEVKIFEALHHFSRYGAYLHVARMLRTNEKGEVVALRRGYSTDQKPSISSVRQIRSLVRAAETLLQKFKRAD